MVSAPGACDDIPRGSEVEFIHYEFEESFVKTSDDYKEAVHAKLTEFASRFAPVAVTPEPVPSQP